MNATPPPLDAAARPIDYLRVSITDRCNERCLYCLPEGFTGWREREELLSWAELLQVVRAAVSLGFRKFRVTGGEPLVRPGAEGFLRALLALPGVEQVGLSTNGLRLARFAPALGAAGLRSVNVSLDALDPEIYRRVTGGEVKEVLAGLDAAPAAGVAQVKLNTVLMRGVNEGEIWPLVQFAAARGFLLRFIELMPVSLASVLREENFFPIAEAKQVLAGRTLMVPDQRVHGHGPAVYYRLPELGATVGFIGAITNPHFCETCNKMRLTAEGRLRPCLGAHGEVDLRPALRPEIDLAGLEALFRQALREKPLEHGFRTDYRPGRVMTAIGG